jgi:hypothetical protein
MSFKERLIQERDELQYKRDKLVVFFSTKTFDDLDKHQQNLLQIQSNVMLTYLEILDQRIELLN